MTKRVNSLLALALSLLTATSALAWPDKSVTIVVPFPPGGGTDTGARIVGQRLSAKWGQSVIIDNKGGAAGQLGADFVAKSKADGYTLMMAATYIAYTIPRRVYELFPMAAAIGAAMGLGALAPTSELTALRAAGWSKLRLSLGALVPLALASLVVFGIGESIGPWGERAAQGVVIGAKSRDLVRTNASGIWARDGEDLLNAKRGALVKGEVELVDARLFRFDATGRLMSITRGDKALVVAQLFPQGPAVDHRVVGSRPVETWKVVAQTLVQHLVARPATKPLARAMLLSGLLHVDGLQGT